VTLLSVAIITRDGASTIGDALRSLEGVADEVIVLDTGSVDGTQEIALSLGARVDLLPWPGDYAQARNESFDRANGRWVMWLDDDEILRGGPLLRRLLESEETRKPFRSISTDRVSVGVSHLYAHTRIARPEGGWRSKLRIRLVRASAGIRWTSPVHAVLDPPRELDLAWGLVTPAIHVDHPRPDAGARHDHRADTLAAAADGDPRLLAHLAEEHIKAGDLGAAARALERAEESSRELRWLPGRSGWLLRLSEMYAELGDVGRAVAIVTARKREREAWDADARAGRLEGFESLGPDVWQRARLLFESTPAPLVVRAGDLRIEPA